jgi:hypothetical protein
MAWTPVPTDQTIVLVNRFYSKKKIRPEDQRNEVRQWLEKQGQSFTPDSCRKFLDGFTIEMADQPLALARRATQRGRKLLSRPVVRFLYELIYFCTHHEVSPYDRRQRADFGQIRKEVLKPFLASTVKPQESQPLSADDVLLLKTGLMRKKQTRRWAYLVDFIFRYQIGIAELCSIKLTDLHLHEGVYQVRIKGCRRRDRRIDIPASYISPIIEEFQSRVFLFETKASTSTTKAGGMPFNRASLSTTLTRWGRKILNRNVTARLIARANKKSPDQDGLS